MILFSQKGYDNTSIEQLSRAAGIGKGTIYTYFRTKSEIFLAFCEEQLEFVYKELSEKTNSKAPLCRTLCMCF